ncbi:cation:proton antiporter [Paludisphaera sp.]|uniref:cation:proton antiporter n=1 Tax=Paludisphaera sp. TaxID=2017432 RepID=UPI00301C6E41
MIVAVGAASVIVADRVGLPSIVLLLGAGLVLGPATGLLDPDALFGPMLLPIVSVSIAVVMFEGGLGLRLREVRAAGDVVIRLTTIGVLITFALVGLLGYYLLDLSGPLAAVLGAIFTVTGPTVILPLVRFLRLRGQSPVIAKWEGIIVDPVGVLFAALVFSALAAPTTASAITSIVAFSARVFLLGVLMGMACGSAYRRAARGGLLPYHLQPLAALGAAVGISGLSEALQPESGIVAATVFGIRLANSRDVSIRHVLEFKEYFVQLILACLFIVLAARLDWAELRAELDLKLLMFVALLIGVVRPLAVAAATVGSALETRDRLMLCLLAPRGIVAASIASVFSLQLVAAGYPDGQRIVPIAFTVIIGTVVFYGLAAPLGARLMGLRIANPQGVIFFNARPGLVALAKELADLGVDVLVVDANPGPIARARLAGVPAHRGNVVSREFFERIDLAPFRRLVAASPNDEANALACLTLQERLGPENVYQAPPEKQDSTDQSAGARQGGRRFGSTTIRRWLDEYPERARREKCIRVTKLTEQFKLDDLRTSPEPLTPVFVVRANGDVHTQHDDATLQAATGDTVICLKTAEPPPAT